MDHYSIGYYTSLLGLHGLLGMISIIVFAMIFGLLLFPKELSESQTSWLRKLSVTGAVLVVLLMLTGIYTDVQFAHAPSWLTGPILFDSMEHISQVGVPMVLFIAYLVHHYRGRLVSELPLKQATGTLIGLFVLFLLVQEVIGAFITKMWTLPPHM